jgi:predicted RNA-binding Zn ribbon-like protein
MPKTLSEKNFYFIGNYLCLDFINTQIVEGGQPVDLLGSFDDLVSWLVQAQVLDETKAEEIIRDWGDKPETESVFEHVLDFRANLRQTMERIVMGKPVSQSVIIQINELLHHKVGYAEIKRTNRGFAKHLQFDFKEPIDLLWPVADSACDILCYADLSLIKKCENKACVLFFYDTTKNHSRRWCSMSACGNRMKVAAHYRRLRRPNTT